MKNSRFYRIAKKFAPYLGLLLLILVSIALGGSTFLAAKNLRNIMIQSSMLMVISVGTAFVMAHGDMDFANGGIMGLTMVIAIVFFRDLPTWAFLVVCLLIGFAMGALVGVLVTKLRVVAFIVGMCIMRLCSAILSTITQSQTWSASPALSGLNTPSFYLITCVIVVLLGLVAFEYTKVGQYNKAIGVNRAAAKLSGIPVDRYLIFSFAASGLCAGVVAFMTSVRTGGLSNSTGSYEVNALIGLTIGGMPLTGGSKAYIRSAVIGALSLTILNNILVLCGVNADFVNVIKGAVFLLLVLISYRKRADSVTA